MRRTAAVCALVLACAGAASAASDPYRGQQWNLDRIGAPAAWATGTGAGATIAVVDSGVDAGHQDLQVKMVAGTNVVEPGRPTADDNGHGTHVSGIAAAVTGNGVGIAGVAPAAKIMPVRALADGSGSSADIGTGIRWAADHGATVINLSLGEDVVIRTVLGSSLEDAMEYAWSKGSIPVIAAGNDTFGSGYGNVRAVVVVATTPEDTIAGYSNSSGGLLTSAKWAISAPGGAGDGRSAERNILSTYWTAGKSNQYAYLAGTSMAAPHVSGALAILRALGLNQQQAVDRVLASARDLGSPGRDSTYGSGLLDVAKAVAGLGTNPAAGKPSTAAPVTGGAPAAASGTPGASSVPAPASASPAGSPPVPAAGGAEAPAATLTPAPALAVRGAPPGNRSAAPIAVAAGVLLAAAAGIVFLKLRPR